MIFTCKWKKTVKISPICFLVRLCKRQLHFLISRSETGSVGIWSLDEALRKVEECRNFSITSPEATVTKEVPRDTSATPLFSFKGHQVQHLKKIINCQQSSLYQKSIFVRIIHFWRIVKYCHKALIWTKYPLTSTYVVYRGWSLRLIHISYIMLLGFPDRRIRSWLVSNCNRSPCNRRL